MKRILVTGGGGFLGSALCEKLFILCNNLHLFLKNGLNGQVVLPGLSVSFMKSRATSGQ